MEAQGTQRAQGASKGREGAPSALFFTPGYDHGLERQSLLGGKKPRLRTVGFLEISGSH